jgi:Protein of unknown function (DUF3089)
MKKALIGIGIVLAAAAGVAFYYRDVITMLLAFNAMRPQHSFAADAPSSAPDYGSIGNWASLPDRSDPADVVAGTNYPDNQSTAAADVFFVHPTTYFSPDHWNQPLDDEISNYLIDRSVLRNQASVFNGCCKVYVPRYRQATMYSFAASNDDSRQALELAYQDVLRAFDYFIQHYNQGRPFILAGHSQGSLHLQRLLKDRVIDSPLKDRLVAVYAIGIDFSQSNLTRDLPGIHVCESAEQIGCLVSWNSVGPKVTRRDDMKDNICVNPLTWMANDARADRSLNEGGVSYPSDTRGDLVHLQPTHADMNSEHAAIDVGVADAQCRDGMLLVTGIRSRYYTSRPLGRDNYHIYDYSFFHTSVRKNAIARVRRYLALHPPLPEAPAAPAPQSAKPDTPMPGQD